MAVTKWSGRKGATPSSFGPNGRCSHLSYTQFVAVKRASDYADLMLSPAPACAETANVLVDRVRIELT